MRTGLSGAPTLPPRKTEFPTAELKFEKDGTASLSNDIARTQQIFADAGVTDLLVICGGWGDERQTRRLYERFEDTVSSASGRTARFSAHTYGFLRLYWHASRWPGDAPEMDATEMSAEDLEARHTASLEMEVTSLRGAFTAIDADQHLLKVWQMVRSAGSSVTAQVSLVEHIRELVRRSALADQYPDEYATRRFLSMHPIRLLEAASLAVPPTVTKGRPAPDDCTTGADDLPARCDVNTGIRNLLRYAVAHELRRRSELLGSKAMCDTLLAVGGGLPQTRIHFVGHSFGARALLAALRPRRGQPSGLHPRTITLLQGMLPHDAFSPDTGVFQGVTDPKIVSGPILVTHTLSDEMAGMPYAIARRIAITSQADRQLFLDPPRAIARDGISTPGASDISLRSDPPLHLDRGKVIGINANGVIRAHSDICHPRIADVILSAATLPE